MGQFSGYPPPIFAVDILSHDQRACQQALNQGPRLKRSSANIGNPMPESLVLAKFYQEMENPPWRVQSTGRSETQVGKW